MRGGSLFLVAPLRVRGHVDALSLRDGIHGPRPFCDACRLRAACIEPVSPWESSMMCGDIPVIAVAPSGTWSLERRKDILSPYVRPIGDMRKDRSAHSRGGSSSHWEHPSCLCRHPLNAGHQSLGCFITTSFHFRRHTSDHSVTSTYVAGTALVRGTTKTQSSDQHPSRCAHMIDAIATHLNGW